ncbi:hypothetical protein VE03_01358 [Pseudogymnoascus sp. 23342-1-I1]|nr:hypothetical protein VE03_01358 [Pseudogymnoascus sp. 23342-1-I1]
MANSLRTREQARDPMEPQKRSSTWIGSPIGLRPDQTASLALLLESPSLSYNLKETSASRRPEQNPEDENGHAEDGAGSPVHMESSRNSVSGAIEEEGGDVLEELSKRAVNLFKLFRLAAERERCLDQPREQWLRAATWWLLKARTNLSIVTYNKLPVSDRICQDCHRYLAKTLWVIEKARSLSDRVRNTGVTGGGGTLNDDFGVIKDGLRKLANTMKEQKLLASMEAIALVAQDFDYSIMVQYPTFTPDIWDALSKSNRGPLVLQDQQRASSCQTIPPTSDLLPLSDTPETFVYATMFVDVMLFERSKEAPSFKFPCLLSVRRKKTQKTPEILIASQNGLLNLLVSLDSDIEWHKQPHTLEIKVWMSITARVQLSSWDFYGLRRVFNYTSHLHLRLQPWAGEELIFEAKAKSVQYAAPNPEGQRFPTLPAPDCVVRVFENVTTETSEMGTCNSQRGFRLAVMTNPSTRDLRYVCHNMGFGKLIRYALVGKDGDQGLQLSFGDANQESSITLYFSSDQKRQDLLRSVTGQPDTEEVALTDVVLRSVITAEGVPTPSSTYESPISALALQRLRVFPSSIIIEGSHGVLTDRFDIRSTTLRMRLPHNLPQSSDHQQQLHQLLVYRQEQSDLTMGVSQASVPIPTQHSLAEALRLASKPETVRAYQFADLRELHRFQAALTGSVVRYDGYAASFSIARRRMLVPVYRQLKASVVRLQVVSAANGKAVKLAAFFKDFRHASAMIFELKPTDVFESFTSRQGRFGVRLVDAKFALPKKVALADDGHEGFVDFRTLEYPGEHDDIAISFDVREVRDKFAGVLPALVNKLHKV